jgi:hypothetical protein
LFRLKIRERFAVGCPFFQNGGPAQAGLGPF